MELLNKLSSFLKKEKTRELDPLEQSLDQVVNGPGNARAHLKLAEIYQKKGEKRKAIAEYLEQAKQNMTTTSPTLGSPGNVIPQNVNPQGYQLGESDEAWNIIQANRAARGL